MLTVDFELDGQPFTALNGGPVFQFNEAISLQVFCETQAELDEFWSKLSAGGRQELAAMRLAEGQVRAVLAGRPPRMLPDLITGPESPGPSEGTMAALLQMKKLDIAAIQRAYDGVSDKMTADAETASFATGTCRRSTRVFDAPRALGVAGLDRSRR